MAKIGLSKPIAAVYNFDDQTDMVAYSNNTVLGRYTEISIDVENADDNVLYADNGPAESDTSFAGGTVSMTTDDLSPANMVSVLGLPETAISGTGAPEGAKWVEFDDRQNAPYIGLGGIIKRKVGGAIKYQAFVLPKIKFQNPSLAVTTQGESIEWQTQKLTADISRDDTTNHRWQALSTYLDSEADAVKIIELFFGIGA